MARTISRASTVRKAIQLFGSMIQAILISFHRWESLTEAVDEFDLIVADRSPVRAACTPGAGRRVQLASLRLSERLTVLTVSSRTGKRYSRRHQRKKSLL